MFKRLAVLACIVVLFSSIIGCSANGTSGTSSASNTAAGGTSEQKSGKEKVKLRIAWWGGQLRHDLTTKVIEMYKAENPNVEIETEFLSFADYLKKMSTEAAGGQLPDVLQMSDSDLPEYVKKNLLIDLDSYVKSGALDLKDVDESYISGGKINNKLYGINLGSNGYSFAYDPQQSGWRGNGYLTPITG